MTYNKDFIVRLIFTALLFAPLIAGIVLKKRNKLDPDKMCVLIIMTGILLRVLYIYHTKVTVRQHDVGSFSELDGGHAAYIMYLYRRHHLPQFDPRTVDQFYHPPLHHIISALWLALMNLLGVDMVTDAPETLQALTMGYSSLFCVFAYKAFKRLHLKDKGLVLATAFVTFHPTLIILSGSINNDMLSGLFAMLAIYLTIKWSQDKKWSSIILLAFSIGLGMMTKLTVGLLAPAVAAVFLVMLIRNRKSFWKFILQFISFGIICIPLGLAWVIRNYLKFDVPFNYVPLLPTTSGQYIDMPIFRRLTDLGLYQLSSPFIQWKPDGDPYNEHNPVIAMFKTAMFDEGTYFRHSITLQSFCAMLLLCNIVISIIAVIGLVMIWIKYPRIKLHHKLFITLISLVIFGNYIIFCMNFPHVCTQNMRYCLPLIFTAAAVCGMLIERDKLNNNFFRTCKAVLCRCTAAFCTLSSIMVIAMGFYYLPQR